ncbi:hypothetical protein SAMN05421813_12643 [Daejeonella rubra]|uniref:Uncharacterized protein n=1 Tax=Daejeonella rubra TaxID=990371 RepID=A0A1G9WQS1_9SPHI|nr:hypothetical protein [Daejeonella rubra]SDM86882.1 hypothetical protein SAMN05421813_12643 [Daejeonella rubra]
MKELFRKYLMNGSLQITVLLTCLLFLYSGNGFSQTIASYNGSSCTFNTNTEIANGCTTLNYITIQYNLANGNYPNGWTLSVKANGDFSNGSTIIPAQYVSLGFSSANGGPGGETGTGYQILSTTLAKNLITTSSQLRTPPSYYFEHKLNMKVQGGNHLAVGTGTYSTTLTVSLLAKNGTVIATSSNVQASFVVNFSNSCQGASLNTYSSGQHTFSTYAEQLAGATVTDAVSVQYAPNAASCAGWTLKVKAAGNFSNGSQSIAPQYFSLRFNRVSAGSPSALAIGVDNTPVMINNTDVTLINQSNAAFVAYSGTEHKFDMLIQGGIHLLVPNGTYTGTLIFSLFNQNNELVSMSTVNVSIYINSSSNSYTVELQNSANEIDLVFNTLANYTNGVSVAKARGLRIVGYQPYQVLIKTSGLNLVGSDSNTIPVSAVSVETTKFTSTSGGVSTFTRELSTADQIIITNPMVDYTQQSVEYNLRYYTAPNDSRLSGKSGVFSTTVLFVVIAQ